MRNKVTLVERGLVHFCVRYAPMVRLAAPSAAIPKTVLMEGQEQLKTESLCLSYSSTKASWERHGEKEKETVNWAVKEYVFTYVCVLASVGYLMGGVERKHHTSQDWHLV